MKVKRSEAPEGKIELKITAPADKVKEAIRFVNFQLAMQNGIKPQGSEDLTDAIKEKVGEAYYDSFIDFQVMQFLAPFAVTEEKLFIIGAPKVTSSNVTVTPGKELSFTVEVIPKPTYDLEDFSPVKVKAPRVQVAEAEIDQQLVTLAENYSTLEKDDGHPVQDGNDVMLSLKTVDSKGQEVKQLTAERRAYTLGQGFLPKGFDENLLDMKPGQTKTFDVSSPDFWLDEKDIPEEGSGEEGTFTFTVTVLEIQKRVIPAITDEWVKKNIPGPSTVPELREEIRKQGLAQREREAENMKSFLVASEFAKRFKGSIP
ncbi:MAG: hypothetical protein LBL27_02355, partial [Coriobacteriales bacterium]|nr:hypothetical protein [Coriobacteriales bacterium]